MFKTSVRSFISDVLFTSHTFEKWSKFLPIYISGSKAEAYVGATFFNFLFRYHQKFTLLQISSTFTALIFILAIPVY